MHEMARRAVVAGGLSFLVNVAFGRAASSAPVLRGANLVETPNALFGSEKAAASLRNLAATGANCVAIIPFFWQSTPDDPGIVLGDALPLDRIRLGIAQARAAGLCAIIKPHVWIPGHWAGEVAMRDQTSWKRWFAAYSTHLGELAALAEGEGADAMMIGTELSQTSHHPEWLDVIARARSRFRGTLSYAAHGPEEAGRVPFWGELDTVSASLYPVLGAAQDETSWRNTITVALRQSLAVAQKVQRPFWIAEFGIRSARDATLRPWESAEERLAEPDALLQAAVIGAWLEIAGRTDRRAELVWRWFTDPAAGGREDTDFTVQNKPAEAVLRRYWTKT